MAAGIEKAAGNLGARKDELSIPPDTAAQAAELLRSVKGNLKEIAAGPEPAPEPQKSEKTGEDFTPRWLEIPI